MPPWVASVPRYAFTSRGIAIERTSDALRCRNLPNARTRNLRIRSASTNVSPTAINYRPRIPPQKRELHDALSVLGAKAEQYVNLSRLQLALRGLEVDGEEAVTRVAILGLDSQAGAQRLARLLVADPLGKEESWEKELEQPQEGGVGGVLLRFGDANDAHPPSPLYKILSVPSRILGTHNLEILVSTLNTNLASTVTSQTTERSQDSVLVPKLQTSSARAMPVPYPVHKTLILGEGLDSAISFGKFTADSTEATGAMVKVAIDLPPPSKEVKVAERSVSTPVNIEIGTEALAAIRSSVQNATFYEKNWSASNLPTLTGWLLSNLQSPSTTALKPSHIALVSSLLHSASEAIEGANAQQSVLSNPPATTTQIQVAGEMIQNLEVWAEKGHEELRDGLDEAFHSKSWNRLKWWKLWWRVDDVGMVLEEVLQRRWLVGTEMEGIYLAGRMRQAGFAEDVSDVTVAAEPIISAPGIADPTSSEFRPTPTPVQDPAQTAIPVEVKQNIPWPTLISTSRAALLSTTLPPLQALSQRLVLTTLSTTSLSSALSALLYVSVSSTSVFEASAIAALGLTISLRRMQRVWEGAREDWMKRVREEGRQTLKGVEEDVRLIVGERKVESADTEGVRERREAMEAVEKAKEALSKISG